MTLMKYGDRIVYAGRDSGTALRRMEPLLRGAMAGSRRTLGAEHPGTLASFNSAWQGDSPPETIPTKKEFLTAIHKCSGHAENVLSYSGGRRKHVCASSAGNAMRLNKGVCKTIRSRAATCKQIKIACAMADRWSTARNPCSNSCTDSSNKPSGSGITPKEITETPRVNFEGQKVEPWGAWSQ